MRATRETKYRPAPVVALPDRTWPGQVIDRAPLWCSSDLRDGNQALIEPMDRARKRRMFDLLVAIGFKEIEVGFPVGLADRVRLRAQPDRGGPDPRRRPHPGADAGARGPDRAAASSALRGAKRATMHFYNATRRCSGAWCSGTDRAGVMAIAVRRGPPDRASWPPPSPRPTGASSTAPRPSPRTELDFARDICDAVTDVWQPTPERKAILNLPATVEVSTPNVYADQIEWMHRNLARRDASCSPSTRTTIAARASRRRSWR